MMVKLWKRLNSVYNILNIIVKVQANLQGVAKYISFVRTVTYKNLTHENFRSRLISKNAGYN